VWPMISALAIIDTGRRYAFCYLLLERWMVLESSRFALGSVIAKVASLSAEA
jgi:hypothetical protein